MADKASIGRSILEAARNGTATIEVFTDGSYNSQADKGGWAAVFKVDEETHVLSGGRPQSKTPINSSRMEFLAVLHALNAIQEVTNDVKVKLYSDCQRVVDSAEQYFMGEPQSGPKYKNTDLREQINMRLSAMDVSIHKVKAHSGVEGNELADKAAKMARR